MQVIVRRAAQSALVRNLDLTAPIVALVLAALLFASGGCAQLKEIPLFNNDAMLRNRIASARETRTKVNDTISEFKESGWLTQEDIDKDFLPVIKTTGRLVDEADALRIAGSNDDSVNKIDAAKALLKVLRDELNRYRKDHQ